jgi:TRAP transporter TAXI family solute receptor
MRRLITFAVLALVLVGLVLSGCQGAPAASPTQPAPAATQAAPQATQAQAQATKAPEPAKSVNLKMATGSTGGTYYPLGAAIAKVVGGKAPGINITVQSTGATVENLRLLGKKEVELALAMASMTDYAFNGTETFKESGAIKNFRAIGNIYPDVIHLIVQEDSGIKDIPDLKGKKFASGPPGSGTVISTREILDAYGLSESDIQGVQATFQQSADQFKDRQVVGGLFVLSVPSSTLQEMLMMRKGKFLPVDLEKVKAKYGFYGAFTIPANTYEGQTEPVETVVIPSLLLVREDIDADTVYRITKAIYENGAEIGAIHAAGKSISLDTALDGVTIPLHPGAEKYFKEKGKVN